MVVAAKLHSSCCDGQQADARNRLLCRPQVFFLFTPVSTSTLQLFSCIRIGNAQVDSPFRGKWLAQDMTQRCFRGTHLKCAVAGWLAALSLKGQRRSRSTGRL